MLVKWHIKFRYQVICEHMFSILFTYLLILLLAFLAQRKLIYFPETYPVQQLTEKAHALSLQPWPSTWKYRGLISQNTSDAPRGTLVVFHGNAGSALGRAYYTDALEKLGYRVILAEYPGYGARAGKPSEQTLIADAVQTAQLARSHFGGPLYLWGESLGGGVISGVIQTGQVEVQGIALIAPFDSLANIAQHHYPLLLGKWLTRDRFDNIKNLHSFSGNTAIIMAQQDEIIPNQYTLNLFKNLPSRKKLWTFKDAGHNTLPLSPDLPWWTEVAQFLEQEPADYIKDE